MLKQTIACLIFLSTLPMLAFSQQTQLANERQMTPIQLFENHRGEIESFKSLVFRFEVAWQEAELESMVDLKAALSKQMYAANAIAYPTNLHAEQAELRLAARQKLLKELENLSLETKDNAIGKKAERTIFLFKEYIRHYEADLEAHAVTLRK
jgi:hypothetical protein